MIKNNILETIGNTPMVRINRLCTKPGVNIFAKLEGFNPTGSIKDRIARFDIGIFHALTSCLCVTHFEYI